MAASDDPKSMTAGERLQAVAAILAGGILRGMQRTGGILRNPGQLPKTIADRLELSGPSRLTVTQR